MKSTKMMIVCMLWTRCWKAALTNRSRKHRETQEKPSGWRSDWKNHWNLRECHFVRAHHSAVTFVLIKMALEPSSSVRFHTHPWRTLIVLMIYNLYCRRIHWKLSGQGCAVTSSVNDSRALCGLLTALSNLLLHMPTEVINLAIWATSKKRKKQFESV